MEGHFNHGRLNTLVYGSNKRRRIQIYDKYAEVNEQRKKNGDLETPPHGTYRFEVQHSTPSLKEKGIESPADLRKLDLYRWHKDLFASSKWGTTVALPGTQASALLIDGTISVRDRLTAGGLYWAASLGIDLAGELNHQTKTKHLKNLERHGLVYGAGLELGSSLVRLDFDSGSLVPVTAPADALLVAMKAA